MRSCVRDGLDREIVATIQRVLSQVTSVVQTSLRAGDFIKNQDVLSVQFATREVQGVDLPTHKLPTYNEVAAILLMIMWEPEETLLCTRSGGLERISDRHRAYDPLHFRLLFPHCELGWHLPVRHQGDATNHNNRVS